MVDFMNNFAAPLPYKQLKYGVKHHDIQCKYDLVLVVKSNKDYAACVKYETASELIERGWGVCSDLVHYGRGNPCGPHSSGVISFDSYKKDKPEPKSESDPRDIEVMARGQIPAERFLDEETVRVEGKMAEEICAILDGECPPFYLGNIQDDGSIMVGFVISEKDKIKQYQFFIKNDTLSYAETIKEDES